MKKIYQNPTTEIINIETAQMIAESYGFDEQVDTSGLGDDTKILSRGSSVWGEDEDEY